jgi:hypothetical protein
MPSTADILLAVLKYLECYFNFNLLISPEPSVPYVSFFGSAIVQTLNILTAIPHLHQNKAPRTSGVLYFFIALIE